MTKKRQSGFTLIEILTALAVLSMIVVAMANMFSHGTSAWDTGQRRVTSLMTGRALMDYFARESAMALCDPGGPFGAPGGSGFMVLKSTDDPATVDYSLADLFEADSTVATDPPSATFVSGDYPYHVELELKVTTSDKGRDDPKIYTGRAFLWNRNRYRFD
jgi:prepilin-type N-terminal cleavage/methylation domain-containing protein